MTSYKDSFKDIPGTTVFEVNQARLGYHLNMFCMSLVDPEKRARFKADERAFLEKFPMSEAQRQAVLERDYNRMIELGGNVYFLGKISATDGVSFGAMVASMTDISRKEYLDMMSRGGRPIAGNRSRSEWNGTGGKSRG
jgi:protocatechuate 4,5-dioxygenase alpha chain